MNHFEEDFLTRRPRQNRKWEKRNDLTVLLIPKFGDHFIGKWLRSKMSRPNYRLKLDEIGSFVWHQCDGSRNVKQIGDALADRFGEKVEPVHQRLILFFKSLEKSGAIIWV